MIKKICAISSLIFINHLSFSYSSEFKEALSHPDIWNKKKARFTKELDFSSKNEPIKKLIIKGIDFSNMSLKNLTFENCKFVDVSFVNADLKTISFIDVEFEKVDLDGAILADDLEYNKETSHIDLVNQYSEFIIKGQDDKAKGLNKILGLLKLQLKDKKLKKINLTNIDLSGANLKNTDLTEANLEGAFFKKTNLKNCKFNRANLTNAVFKYARIKNTNFTEANLTGSQFILENSLDLKKANLTEDQIRNLGPSIYNEKDDDLKGWTLIN